MNWLQRALRPRYAVMAWLPGVGKCLPDLTTYCWTWRGAERRADRLNESAWRHEIAVVYKVVEA